MRNISKLRFFAYYNFNIFDVTNKKEIIEFI